MARTERDKTEIVHTTDYRVMLDEAVKTETHAAASYRAFLDLPGINAELHDAIEHIYFQEERAVEELKQLRHEPTRPLSEVLQELELDGSA